ncbi:hypothetical protein Tco_0920441, partial [Tanacetum coccineum]
IEDVIEEEEGFIEKGGFSGKEDNIEDVSIVANDLCSLMIQTTLNVNFVEVFNTKSHELMSFGKSIIIKVNNIIKSIMPKTLRNTCLSKKSKIGLHNVAIVTFNKAVLLTCMRTRSPMNNS